MMHFPQQLVTEISEHLSPIVSDFIERNEFSFRELNEKTIVREAMEQYISVTAKDVINKNMRNERKSRKRKKEGWTERIHKDCSAFSYDDPQNPFFSEYIAYNSLSPADKRKLGWANSFDFVIDDKLKQLDEWCNNSETYLIEFPALSTLKQNKIYNALISDVYIDIYNYLKENYNLNINSFQKIYTDTIIENPLFGEKKETLNLQATDEEGTLVERLFLTKDSVFNTIVKIDEVGEGLPMKSLGPKDLDMIQYGIFNNITDSFYSNRTVITKLREFAQILCPSKYNRVYTKKAGDLLISYQKFSYSVRDLENDIAGDAFNLFDRVTIKNPADFIPSEENPYSPDADVIIHFGDRLYQDIIQAQVIGITQSSYDKVDSELAHLLAPILQMQRTILTKEMPPECKNVDAHMTKNFEYVFFSSSVRTLTRRKKDNVLRLCQALNEYVEAQLFVKSFTYKNNVFVITFYPLTTDELADVRINKKDRIETKQLTMKDIILNK